MTTPTPRVLVLQRPDHIEIVAHPLRLEIIERLQVDGADSIKGLARKLDRRANALTYHVRLLEKAGVIVRAGSRKAGRRDEVVYALGGERVAIAANTRSRPMQRATTRTASPMVRRQKTWLTEAELATAQQRLQSLERFLERCHRRKQGRPYALTVVLVPIG